METIPVSECKPGVPLFRSRNLTVGFFNQADDGFVGIREKGGSRSPFTESHRDIGPPHGTAAPYEDLGPLPDGIEAREYEALDPVRHRVHGTTSLPAKSSTVSRLRTTTSR